MGMGHGGIMVTGNIEASPQGAGDGGAEGHHPQGEQDHASAHPLLQTLEPSILLTLQGLDRDEVFRRLNILNLAHHLAISEGPEKLNDILGLPEGDILIARLDSLIHTAASFHGFLEENRIALKEMMSNISALVFGRLSHAVGMFEDYISGEDCLRDTLINLVAFALSAMSERSYISSAEFGQRGVLRDHALSLYMDIYSYLKETRRTGTSEEAREISELMGRLHEVLRGAVLDQHGLLLFTGMYLALYNLRAGDILAMTHPGPRGITAEV